MWVQLTIENELPGYLPCSNPDLVEGWVAIEDIFEGRSCDFLFCEDCGKTFCECNLNEKREDPSYAVLLEHFRKGGMINQPINYDPRYQVQRNGHHRLIAAYDAGYTHVPYNSELWGDTDWQGTANSEGMSW